jgi:hypothetical protein
VIDVTSGAAYGSISAAISGSAANDVIQISAGAYVEDYPLITHSLTLESVGGLASLTTPLAQPANGRAILYVPGDLNVSLSISGLELSGAVDAPAQSNGAGILFETGNAALTVSNSWIHGNQDGILTGGVDAASTGGMTVRIDHSEIDHNGLDAANPRYGFDHNIYVGNVTQLTVTDSYIHDALGGHEIKSRALSSTIISNRIQDGPTATTSYSIDLPDGGTDIVSGNVIEKGAASPNRYLVHYGGEGTYAGSSLQLSANTIVNDRSAGGTALYNQTQDGTGHNVAAVISDNTLYGLGAGNLNQDDFGPPFDSATGNNFVSGASPALDTSPPFAVPEPDGVWLLPALLVMAVVIRRR